jgi:hypothetical protein
VTSPEPAEVIAGERQSALPVTDEIVDGVFHPEDWFQLTTRATTEDVLEERSRHSNAMLPDPSSTNRGLRIQYVSTIANGADQTPAEALFVEYKSFSPSESIHTATE